jgi:transposase-like protein
MDFHREFPDDRTCLDWLWRNRYSTDGSHAHCPKCDQTRKFSRTASRPSYSCHHCGHHIHPTAGTIFHRSATSLHLWFYAMYLMTSTRCAVSAKHLERELGVGYKTAWRMANLIRNELMTQDDDGPLSGEVEVDETWIGGKPKASDTARARREAKARGEFRGYARRPKATVFGAVERGGRIRATVVPDSLPATLSHNVKRFVLPEARLITDELSAYNRIGLGYREHDQINHGARVYVSGDVHTNTIEGFFGNMKNGIRGNYHAVSRKWLQGYLNEFVWRHNHRPKLDGRGMFRVLALRAADTALPWS